MLVLGKNTCEKVDTFKPKKGSQTGRNGSQTGRSDPIVGSACWKFFQIRISGFSSIK